MLARIGDQKLQREIAGRVIGVTYTTTWATARAGDWLMPLNFSDLEAVYEGLATALDTVSPAEREVFLCKLVLLLAREVDDISKVQTMISNAQNHLELT